MKIKPLLSLGTLLGALVLFNGCAALVVGGAAGAGTYAYVKGELKVTENASLDRAWRATQGAIKELEFTVTSESRDALAGRLIARTALDRKIAIRLTRAGENLTEIRIRVGTFGDEDLSRVVHEKIKQRL